MLIIKEQESEIVIVNSVSYLPRHRLGPEFSQASHIQVPATLKIISGPYIIHFLVSLNCPACATIAPRKMYTVAGEAWERGYFLVGVAYTFLQECVEKDSQIKNMETAVKWPTYCLYSYINL